MITTLKEFKLLLESISQQILLNVDIQPEYENNIYFNINEWVKLINNNSNKNIIFLYNGEDIGMISEGEYIDWLYNLGINDDVLDSATFFDKGYGFFRLMIDKGFDDSEIIEVVKHMFYNKINTSNELTDDDLIDFDDNIKLFFKDNDDQINIPDVMNYINNLNGSMLVSGGDLTACLKEIEICLEVLNKDYIYSNFTY